MRGGARSLFCGRRRAPFLAGLPFFGKAAPPPFSERLSIFLCRTPSSAVRKFSEKFFPENAEKGLTGGFFVI